MTNAKDPKLNRHQVTLIKPVQEAKYRAPRLDELDQARALRDIETERLFDDPEAA